MSKTYKFSFKIINDLFTDLIFRIPSALYDLSAVSDRFKATFLRLSSLFDATCDGEGGGPCCIYKPGRRGYCTCE